MQNAEEEYWDPPVVTPAAQATRVSEAPATTFVISGDELRHSGATSLPEILRRVPGFDVRQLTVTDSQNGLRGPAFEINDRVLVMIDGRTVFLDFIGGTVYEALPVSLIDIDRIEVVMGPGAAVYGNKAMQGVVNIITKSATDYPFTEARIDVGPPSDGRIGVRSGSIEGPWRLRATALGRRLTRFDTDATPTLAGGSLAVAYAPAPRRELSLEAGATSGRTYIIPTASRIDGFDLSLAHARLDGRLGLGAPSSSLGDFRLLLAWSGGWASSRTFPDEQAPANDHLATFHTSYVEASHELLFEAFGIPMHGRWGSELRMNTVRSRITADEQLLLNVAVFANDELILGPVRLTLGLRADRQTLTDINVSPRVSLVYSPAPGHQLRAAFNTGYNNPNLLQHFAELIVAPGLTIVGNQALRSERIEYLEASYAGALAPWVRVMLNGFGYRMSDWISLAGAPVDGAVPYINNDRVDAFGFEAGVDLSLAQHIGVYARYSHVRLSAREDGAYGPIANFGTPRHKLSAGLRAGLFDGAYLTLDGQYIGTSEIARIPSASTGMSSGTFTRFALQDFLIVHGRAGYAWPGGFDVSIGATNLLNDHTQQYPGAERPELRVMTTLAYTQ